MELQIIESMKAPERAPIVFTKDGAVFASSRDVAAYFEKRHDNVLKAINNLDCSSEFNALNFKDVEYSDAKGEVRRAVEMTRDGFVFLVMGFTGKSAGKWKESYILAFNRMEDELKAKPEPVSINYLDPKNILGFIGALQDQVNEKDKIIAGQVVRLEKMDRLEGSKGLFSFQEAAKTLKLDPLYKLQDLLVALHWIYKRAGNKSWLAKQAQISNGYFEHVDYVYFVDGDERVSTRAKITPKGLLAISDILTKRKH